MAKVKTVTLTGSETEVSALGGQNVAIKNLSTGSVYASAHPDITPDSDNVIEIPAGGGEVLLDAHGKVHLLGVGKVQCIGTDYATPPFRLASGCSSGGGDTEKGAYCGITEFVSSSEGVRSATIEHSSGFHVKLAEILAKETGWELQSDGVTVLKNGVGFTFAENCLWVTNDIGAKISDYNYRYISDDSPAEITIDICSSAGGTVAFGFHGTKYGMNFSFVLSQDEKGNAVAFGTWTKGSIWQIRKGQSSPDTLSLIGTSMSVDFTELALAPSSVNGGLYKDVFFFAIYPSGTVFPADSVFEIGGKRFRVLRTLNYSENPPVLAIPL